MKVPRTSWAESGNTERAATIYQRAGLSVLLDDAMRSQQGSTDWLRTRVTTNARGWSRGQGEVVKPAPFRPLVQAAGPAGTGYLCSRLDGIGN